MKQVVKFKKLSSNAIMPTKATEGSAAYDLYCPCDYVLTKGRQIINMHFAIEMPSTLKANIRARSGFSAKGFEAYKFIQDTNENFVVEKTPIRVDADSILGLADSDYRGAIGVIVKYNSDESVIIKKDTRIAQMEFAFVPDVDLIEADELSDTDRGEGGFGHTGTK